MLYNTTKDLKKAALQFAGELTDGTSSYDDLAITYLNSLYMGILAGGNEFGMDVSESWVWAKAKQPINLELLPPFESGTITLTNSSFNAVLSTNPGTLDLEGWLLKLDGVTDAYYVRYHSGTSLSLDVAWPGESGTYNFKLIKMNYFLHDDTIVIDSKNRILDFKEAGPNLAAALDRGVYSIANLVTHINSRITAVGGTTTLSYNAVTRKFKFVYGGTTLSLLGASGANAEISVLNTLGFDTQDYNTGNTYTSLRSLNAIQRLVAPITTYRQGLYNSAAEDVGKIKGINYNTMLMKYPVAMLTAGLPDLFCENEQLPDGTVSIRFNKYVTERTKLQIDYIPVQPNLQNNDLSIPLLPLAFREYLAYGAAHKLLLDKSDDKAPLFFQSAQMKLKALINHNRSGVELTNNNFGRIVPRRSQSRMLRTSR